MKRSISLLAALTVVGANLATAQITYSGGTYFENFDGIVWQNDQGIVMANVGAVGAQDALPGLANWQAARVAGTATTTFALYAKDGSSGTGRLYSFGDIYVQERALGSVASGTVTAGFGASFLNASSDTFSSITMSFDREVWRNQSAAADDSLAFAYGFASSGIGSTDFLTHSSMTAFAALNATAPADLGGVTSAARNGNTAPYQAAVSATITGMSWAPGDTLFIRWNDTDNTGTDAGVGIDNLSMVATVPEPSCGLLIGLGFAALALLRRNNR
jgi:hypothetical protein